MTPRPESASAAAGPVRPAPQSPTFSIGQAADALGVEVGALRRLDAAGLVSPGRSLGGQRRYTGAQLDQVSRLHELMAEGLTAAGASRVAGLEDRVAELEAALAQATAARRLLQPRGRSTG